MTARLVGWVPDSGRLDVTLGATVRIGATADNDVVAPVEGVSRTHARVVRLPDGYWLEDAGSRNGTWLNGERITRSLLRHLDVISLGRFAEVVFVESAVVPTSESRSELRAELEWLDGPEQGKRIELPRGETLVGRAGTCQLVIDHPSVSRAHARIIVTGVAVTFEDLGSSSGTFVGGKRLTAPIVLGSGAILDVAGVRKCRVQMTGTAAAASEDVPAFDRPAVDTRSGGELHQPVPVGGETVLRSISLQGLPMVDASPDADEAGPRTELVQLSFAPPAFDTPGGRAAEIGIESPAEAGAAPAALPDAGTQLPPETILGFREVTAPPRALTTASGPEPVNGQAPPDREDADFVVRSGETGRGHGDIVLVTLSGSAGQFAVARGTATIGRSASATIRIDSRDVSRIHARLVVTESAVTLQDEGSVNGTTVNGALISGRRPLAAGDRVSFGDFEFRVDFKRADDTL